MGKSNSKYVPEKHVVYSPPFKPPYSVFITRVAAFRVYWVSRRINRYIGCDLRIFPDCDFPYVKNSEVIVCKKIIAHFNIPPIVAMKRRLYPDFFPCFSKQLFKQFGNTPSFFRRQQIKFIN